MAPPDRTPRIGGGLTWAPASLASRPVCTIQTPPGLAGVGSAEMASQRTASFLGSPCANDPAQDRVKILPIAVGADLDGAAPAIVARHGRPPLRGAQAGDAGAMVWLSAEPTSGAGGRRQPGPLSGLRAGGPNHLDLTGPAPIYVPPTLHHRRLAPTAWLGLPDNQPFSGGSGGRP